MAPNDYPDRLDVVIEVVSDGEEARRRDYEDKRRDYARAEIDEYWTSIPYEGQSRC